MRLSREDARRAAALLAVAAAGAGCGHAAYDRVVVEFDDTAQTILLDAAARPLDRDTVEALGALRPSYIGLRWRL